jgi:hypothetical protein
MLLGCYVEATKPSRPLAAGLNLRTEMLIVTPDNKSVLSVTCSNYLYQIRSDLDTQDILSNILKFCVSKHPKGHHKVSR